VTTASAPPELPADSAAHLAASHGFDLAADLAFALDLAERADAVSLNRFRALDLRVTTKPDRTPVTDADQAVERALRDQLARGRPNDGILGEEYGEAAGTGAGVHRQWILDPIDGTANFLRGVPIWGTLIALAVDAIPVLGVVSAPALGQRWWGAHGLGAFTAQSDGAPRRLAVSGVTTLADASLSYNSLPGWDDAGRLQPLIDLTRSVWRARAIGDMWSYMLVAEGALDIAGEFDLQPYDMAALQPIIEEAGGRFTSVDGQAGPWHGSALATNGFLHDEVLQVLQGR
jgi:histidinol-phosphatase